MRYLKDYLNEYLKDKEHKGKVLSQELTEDGVITEAEFTWDEADDLARFIHERMKKEDELKEQTDFQMRWY